ncbi:MAG: aspartate-semialdehyde dehydrogenase [Proteobacteria bacterium]|nr:aspartate-semialdehyde dehydrogenase [Pseudomonadota bacterium]
MSVAVAGATGLAGQAVIEALSGSALAVTRLHALAGERSLGESVSFRGRSQAVGRLEDFDFSGCQLAFFCTPDAVAAQHAPRALAGGSSVIDVSRALRARADVPLVVAAVDLAPLAALRRPALVASPCGAAVTLASVLAPLHRAAGLTQVVASLYLAAAGAGRAAVETLARESIAALSGQGLDSPRKGAARAFTCSGQIGAAQHNGYTALELGVREDLRRVLAAPELAVSITAARVPVFHGDAMAVHLHTREPLDAIRAGKLLETAPGVTLLSGSGDPGSAKRDTVYVARIRDDLAPERGFDLWIAADGATGSAANCVRIAEALARHPI